jgi:Translation initiation factor eIF3 subunit 135
MAHDGRLYVIDTARLFPPETPHGSRGSHLYRLLRPELVRANATPLSSDAFSPFGTERGRSTIDRRHNDEVRQATALLLGEHVPRLAAHLSSQQRRLNGISVSRETHRFGVNCRHLGLVYNHCRGEATRRAVLTEMCARQLKNHLRRCMATLSSTSPHAYRAEAVRLFALTFSQDDAAVAYYVGVTRPGLLATFAGVHLPPAHSFAALLGADGVARVFQRTQALAGVVFTAEANTLFHAALSRGDVGAHSRSDTQRSLASAGAFHFSVAMLQDLVPLCKTLDTWVDPSRYGAARSPSDAPSDARLPESVLSNLELICEGLTGDIYRATLCGEFVGCASTCTDAQPQQSVALASGVPVALTHFHEEGEFEEFRSIASQLLHFRCATLVRVYGYAQLQSGICGYDLVCCECSWPCEAVPSHPFSRARARSLSRWLSLLSLCRSVYISLSISIFTYLYLYVYLYLSICLFVSMGRHLSGH